MALSPVPARAAPGFTLTDQDGHVLPLSALRGRVVVLEFMDPHCTQSRQAAMALISCYGQLLFLARCVRVGPGFRDEPRAR